MFQGCDKITANLFDKKTEVLLYVNHSTNWLYICLDSNLRILEVDFMNELTVILKNRHHIIVKGSFLFPGRVGARLFEVLCISFEQDHSEAEKLVFSAATQTPETKDQAKENLQKSSVCS